MNPSQNNITRRNFVKKSSLAVGAATIITSGVGLGEVVPASATPCNCVGFHGDSPRVVYTSNATDYVGNCYVLGYCRCSMNGYSGHAQVRSRDKADDNSGATYRALGNEVQHIDLANGGHTIH